MLAAMLLFLATPAHAADGPRTAPEPSDVALFVLAAGGIWFTRRALRRRNRKG